MAQGDRIKAGDGEGGCARWLVESAGILLGAEGGRVRVRERGQGCTCGGGCGWSRVEMLVHGHWGNLVSC